MPQHPSTPQMERAGRETHETPTRSTAKPLVRSEAENHSNHATREKMLESSKHKVEGLKARLEGMLHNLKNQSPPRAASERDELQQNIALIEDRLKKAAETEQNIDWELAELKHRPPQSIGTSLARESTKATESHGTFRPEAERQRDQNYTRNSDSHRSTEVFRREASIEPSAESQESVESSNSRRPFFTMEISEESMRKSIFEESRRDEQRKARFSNLPDFEDEEYLIVDTSHELADRQTRATDQRRDEEARHARSQDPIRGRTLEDEGGTLPKASPFSGLCAPQHMREPPGWGREEAYPRGDSILSTGSDRKMYKIIRHPIPPARKQDAPQKIEEEGRRPDPHRDSMSAVGSMDNENSLHNWIDLGIHKNLTSLGNKRRLGFRDHQPVGLYEEISRTLEERNERLFKLNHRSVLACKQLAFASARQKLCFPEFKDSDLKIADDCRYQLREVPSGVDDDCDSTDTTIDKGKGTAQKALLDGLEAHKEHHRGVRMGHRPSMRSGASSMVGNSHGPRGSSRM